MTAEQQKEVAKNPIKPYDGPTWPFIISGEQLPVLEGTSFDGLSGREAAILMTIHRYNEEFNGLNPSYDDLCEAVPNGEGTKRMSKSVARYNIRVLRGRRLLEPQMRKGKAGEIRLAKDLNLTPLIEILGSPWEPLENV